MGSRYFLNACLFLHDLDLICMNNLVSNQGRPHSFIVRLVSILFFSTGHGSNPGNDYYEEGDYVVTHCHDGTLVQYIAKKHSLRSGTNIHLQFYNYALPPS